ncbi:MAG TPA: Ig-like domain-containing protein, partial [Tepidisphaeraceae bacterium]|nr:Ig-like domain-containing protein [Tepidisphaeraceae bacterium]
MWLSSITRQAGFSRVGKKAGRAGADMTARRSAARHGALAQAVVAADLKIAERLESRLLLTATPAHIFNFNSSFNDFATLGNTSIVDSSFYAPVPSGATAQALMDTGAAFNGGSTPVSAAVLESALGLTAGSLSSRGFGTATNGSAMILPGTFVASAGEIVTFNADFLTSETSGGADDFGFAVLKSASGATTTTIGHTQGLLTATSTKNAQSSNFSSETGTHLVTITIAASGVYSLGFGVVNVGDKFGASGLLIDNVAIPDPINSFDFGTATSPVAANYVPITETAVYTVDQGFGWQPGVNTIGSFDTGITSFAAPDPKVTRDFNYTTGSTFAVDAANGLYDVTLTLGDGRGGSYSDTVSFGNPTSPTDMVNTGGSDPAIVTKTYLVNVTNGQMDLTIGGAPAGSFAAIDGLQISKDLTPFAVTGVTPANGANLSGALTTIQVNFNHPVNAATILNANSISLTDPNLHAVAITGAAQVNTSTINLTFAAQSISGAYTLAIGAGTLDAASNALGINFFSETFNKIAVTTGSFDFGTSISPVASGYSQVTDATAYTLAQGYGWLPGGAAIGSFDTGNTSFSTPNSSVTRDFDYSSGATFGVDIANGLYDVTLTLGDARSLGGYSNLVFFQGGTTPTDTVATGASNAAVITKTYLVGVTNGQLNVGIGAATGAAVIDGLSFQRDTSPFAVASTNPANGSTVNGNLTQISVVFSHPVNSTALNASNYTLTGPGGNIQATGVTAVNGQTVNLAFPAQSVSGSYTLNIGAGVQDTALNTLGPGVSETLNKQVAISGAYDFGTAGSPVGANYTQVTEATAYSAAQGYGWQSGSIGSFDTGIV